MEILKYSDEHKSFRKRLRAFLEKEVIPHIDPGEEDGFAPKPIGRKMGAGGFLCTAVSKEYGGPGGDFLYSVIAAEELAKTNHAGLMAYLHSDIIVPYITAFGSDDIKKKYLPGCVTGEIITAIAMTEPDAGSDLAGISTTAVEDGDEVVINGSKIFISNGINCGIVIVVAKNPAIENPYEAVSLYIVEDGTPGFKKGGRLKKLGYHSQDTAELFFTDCRIPKTNILGQKGMLMEKLQQERLVCSIGAVVAAESILEQVTTHCRETVENGKPLSKRQAVAFELVEMATEVRLEPIPKKGAKKWKRTGMRPFTKGRS